MKEQKILISGGGIAGCTLAHFLRQYGFKPTIVDSAPEFKRIGYLLALNEQIGQVVAEKMGLLDALREFEMPLTNNVMVDTKGRELLRFTLDHATLNSRVGLMLNRADLHLTLYENIKNEVEFRFGKEITAINETESGCEVTFSSGTKETFDLVIAADGIHSKVREMIFGKGVEKYMGYGYFAFMTPNAALSAQLREHEIKIIRGDGFTMAYHRLKGAEIGAYVFHKGEVPERLPPENRRDYMLQHYGGVDPNFKVLVEGMQPSEHVFHDGFTQVVMPSWHKGRVALIGDAAFCPTPASGVGTAMSIAAGYILAKKLSQTGDHTKAFSEYDDYMHPYIQKAQSSASRMLLLAAGGSIISYEFTNFLLRLIPGGLVGRLHSHAIDMPLD